VSHSSSSRHGHSSHLRRDRVRRSRHGHSHHHHGGGGGRYTLDTQDQHTAASLDEPGVVSFSVRSQHRDRGQSQTLTQSRHSQRSQRSQRSQSRRHHTTTSTSAGGANATSTTSSNTGETLLNGVSTVGMTAEQIRMARARERRALRKERAIRGIHNNNNTTSSGMDTSQSRRDRRTTLAAPSSSIPATSPTSSTTTAQATSTDNNGGTGESTTNTTLITPNDTSPTSNITSSSGHDGRRRRLVPRAQLRRFYIVTPSITDDSNVSFTIALQALVKVPQHVYTPPTEPSGSKIDNFSPSIINDGSSTLSLPPNSMLCLQLPLVFMRMTTASSSLLSVSSPSMSSSIPSNALSLQPLWPHQLQQCVYVLSTLLSHLLTCSSDYMHMSIFETGYRVTHLCFVPTNSCYLHAARALIIE
jgi:hypothetical protein